MLLHTFILSKINIHYLLNNINLVMYPPRVLSKEEVKYVKKEELDRHLSKIIIAKLENDNLKSEVVKLKKEKEEFRKKEELYIGELGKKEFLRIFDPNHQIVQDNYHMQRERDALYQERNMLFEKFDNMERYYVDRERSAQSTLLSERKANYNLDNLLNLNVTRVDILTKENQLLREELFKLKKQLDKSEEECNSVILENTSLVCEIKRLKELFEKNKKDNSRTMPDILPLDLIPLMQIAINEGTMEKPKNENFQSVN